MIGVRLAGPADDDDVARMRSEARRLAVDRRGGRHLPDVADRRRTVMIGTIGGVPVGFVDYDDQLPTSTVHALFVEPGARRVGIGHQLIQAVVQDVSSRGATGLDSWALPGDRDTKNFFEAHGLVTRLLTVHRKLDG